MADIPGGTVTPRDPALGPPLDNSWWSRLAEATLGRVIGYGAGGGPPPLLIEQLSKGLLIAFAGEDGGDHGEGAVRGYLRMPRANTQDLMEPLAQDLAKKSLPVIENRRAHTSATQDLFGKPKRSTTAAIGPVPKFEAIAASVKQKRRPRPLKKGYSEDYFQDWISWQEAQFDREELVRESVYETFRYSFLSRERERFEKDAAVQPDIEAWKGRFQLAEVIGAGARGGLPILDDGYHRDSPPTGVGSNWLMGELIHAAWQFDYLAGRVSSDVLVEYMFSSGAPRGEFVDYRTMDLFALYSSS